MEVDCGERPSGVAAEWVRVECVRMLAGVRCET